MRDANFRRHHDARIKARTRRRILDTWYNGADCADPRMVGIMARTPVPCSGPCCGNPRRFFGTPTMQERRATA